MSKFDMQEFESILKPYLEHPKVLEMKNYSHHGITRYDHSYRVAYHTYWFTKKFHFKYKSATIAAFLHDFYLDEVDDETNHKKWINHPYIASYNAEKYFHINKLEKDIIEKHMFPITIRVPKYKESWVVDIIDDLMAIVEKTKTTKWILQPFLNIFLIGLFTIVH